MMTDEQYEAIQAKIVELQNDDYASKAAAQLQAWLGDQVVDDYLASQGAWEVIEGEVIDESWFWLDE
jgi:hypothetical protein